MFLAVQPWHGDGAGPTRALREELTRQMEDASRALEFERAGVLRDLALRGVRAILVEKAGVGYEAGERPATDAEAPAQLWVAGVGAPLRQQILIDGALLAPLAGRSITSIAFCDFRSKIFKISI